MPASPIRTSARCCRIHDLGEACGALVADARRHFAEAVGGHGALRAGKACARRASWPRSIALCSRSSSAAAGHAPRAEVRPSKLQFFGPSCVTASSDGERNRTHRRRRSRRTLGRGRLAVGSDREIVVHELARHAGGRCRSYFEPALGMTIDNGNHLLLSANEAALAFLRTIGSEGKLAGPDEAEIRLRRPGLRRALDCCIRTRVRSPWWIFAKDRRVPGTKPLDYLLDDAPARAGPRREPGQDHRLQRHSLRAAVAPALSCRAQHRAARGLGASRRRDPARDAWRAAAAPAIR